MRASCQLQNHLNKALTLICTNPNCHSQRLLCIKCVATDHQDCLDYLLQIEDVNTGRLYENSNWIQKEKVKQAVAKAQELELDHSEEKYYKTLEEHIDNELQKVVDFFLQKVAEIKQKMLSDAQKSFDRKDIGLKAFEEELRTIYNFDALMDILGSLQSGKNNLVTLSEDLTNFFAEIQIQEYQNTELLSMAEKLNSFPYSFLDFEPGLFDNFKKAIPFELFDKDLQTAQEKWRWSTSLRSAGIDLTDDHLIAKKDGCALKNRAILGDINMCGARYQWELDISSGYFCIATHFSDQDYDPIFGVVELSNELDFEDLPLEAAYGLSMGGKSFNMTEVCELPETSSRKYLCDLDLVNGTFTISSQGVIVGEEILNLKGKRFSPFVILKHRDSSVKLRVPRRSTQLCKEGLYSVNSL